MPREYNVVKQARELFASIASKPSNQHFMKTSGGGEPDLVGVIDGRAVVCECKQPGEKPTMLQYVRLKQWARAGAWALWTDGVHVYDVDKTGKETRRTKASA